MASWKQQRRKWAHRLGRSFFRGLDAKLSGTLQLQMLQQTARYEALLRSGEPLPFLEDTEFRVFSQNGEDGIILFLLAVIGTTGASSVGGGTISGCPQGAAFSSRIGASAG